VEDSILRRRDRTPTITVRGKIAEGLQPPEVFAAVWKELQPIIARLPPATESSRAVPSRNPAKDSASTRDGNNSVHRMMFLSRDSDGSGLVRLYHDPLDRLGNHSAVRETSV
jgi:hypothetical protein